MRISRRDFGLAAAAALLAPRPARAAATERPIDLILAPTNLGLRPENGAQPGTWQAPRVLMEAGLREASGGLTVQRVGAMLTLFCREGPVTDLDGAKASDTERFGALFRGLLERGIYLPPSQFECWFVSTAHGDAEVAATVEAVRDVLAA